MSIGKTVGLAIIIVAICPILLGMVWPDDTEQVDSWEAAPGIDITGDLANKQISVFDTYTGPLNNLSVFREPVDALQFPDPIGTTDTENPYPVSEIESTTTAGSVAISELVGTGKPRYGIGSGTGFRITGDDALYSYGDYWPATNTLILYDEDTVPIKTIAPQLSDVVSGDVTLITFGVAAEWVDLSLGLAGGPSPWIWVNGLINRSVDLWVRMTATPFANTVQIDNLTLTRADAAITVSDGNTSAELGSAYSYINIRLEESRSIVTGLIGVDGFQDLNFTEGNSLEFARSGSLEYIAMKGSYMQWWVKSTVSAIGSTSGIRDSNFSPEAYFGSAHSWQAQIINPSTFGSSIVVAVGGEALTLGVNDAGNVEVTNMITGEKTSEPVRGLRILSLVIDGEQRIFMDGIQVLSAAPGNTEICLEGDWYTSVVISKVTQTTDTNLIWTGGFGLDQAGYCMVGLMSCVAVAIAGSVWGRTSGESVLALHITMILCGSAYLVMM